MATAHERLGLRPNASSDEIKAAYRRLALRWHPDRPGGCADRFRDIKFAAQELQSTACFRRYTYAHSSAANDADGGADDKAWEEYERYDRERSNRPSWLDSPFWEEGQADWERANERQWNQSQREAAQDRRDFRTVWMGIKIIIAGMVMKSVIFIAMRQYVAQRDPELTPDLQRYLDWERTKMEQCVPAHETRS